MGLPNAAMTHARRLERTLNRLSPLAVLLLLSCRSGEDTGESGSPAGSSTPSPVAVSFQPENLDFGDQDVYTTQVRTLLVHNDGEDDLFIRDVSLPSGGGLELGAISNMSLAPDGQVAIDIKWTPASVGNLAAKIEFELASPGGEPKVSKVEAAGAAHGPLVVVSPREYDFGEVKVGCQVGLSFSVSNAGDQAIVIDSLELDGTAAFSLKSGDNADLPWTLEPYSTRQVSVYFSPDTLGDDATVLELRSGDEIWSASLDGVGAVDGEETVSYTVGELAKAVALWHVADCASYAYGTAMDQALPTLFETLNESGASYRMVFLRTSDGVPVGGYDYIDETFSVEAATDAAMEMYAGGCTMNNDASFTTLLNGAKYGADWMDENEFWKKSKISLIGINNDNDTSGGTAATYVEQAKKLRKDSDLVTYHAIGETITGACQASVPFTGFIEAVDLSGGIFLNICDTDWTGHMEKLAAVIMNGSNSIFPLGGTPLTTSIKVKLDGITVSEGWRYDEGLNAVVFDDDAYPPPGTSLDISYLTSEGC